MHSANIVDVEKTAFWSSEEPGVVLNSIAFCRGVNDGEHLLQVILYKLYSLVMCLSYAAQWER